MKEKDRSTGIQEPSVSTLFADNSLTFSKIPDISPTAVKIPDISRFSIQVVTLKIGAVISTL